MPPKNKKMPPWAKNLLFATAVLAVAAVVFLLARPAAAGGGQVAVLLYGDPQQRLELDLTADKTYDIESNGYTIHLKVADGGIAFVNSPCPDHVCEGFGVLRDPGDWAACVPALASLTIEER